MNKPNSYDEVQAGGDFTPIELGGHYGVIKRVTETQSQSGRNMLKVLFDFAPNDKQAGLLMKEFKDDIRPDKKWPNRGTAYILTEDDEGKCSKKLKSFIASVEKSNNAEVQWGEGFAGWFLNKKVGLVFGEVEDEYNGKRTMRHKLRWYCESAKVPEQKIPEPLMLDSGAKTTSSTTNTSEFIPVTDDLADEIPFA